MGNPGHGIVPHIFTEQNTGGQFCFMSCLCTQLHISRGQCWEVTEVDREPFFNGVNVFLFNLTPYNVCIINRFDSYNDNLLKYIMYCTFTSQSNT